MRQGWVSSRPPEDVEACTPSFSAAAASASECDYPTPAGTATKDRPLLTRLQQGPSGQVVCEAGALAGVPGQGEILLFHSPPLPPGPPRPHRPW